ncbi:MAG: hypothetical protein QGH42_09285 [Kiritimatiellia bacterium]|jgi:hypothetical protein|nr:hypothetical protein [Kiritimatiellia bacterium]MDP6629681.1 hypothetical protein [Kiritimatiellia bacterium]MDP6811125.1 hypothetical protein [Kiritimatiellia bacterium]MDP7024414.1 hypothetical protein [Kiritimatiellia bacterium]
MSEQGTEHSLDSFDAAERNAALVAQVQAGGGSAVETSNVNMHMHSFFSYNAEGWSPTHLAWAAHQAGFCAGGLCDFDVLDGLEEYLAAGRTVGLRTAVHMETRATFSEYADVDISSPGEPGVTYIMGGGFARVPEAGSPQESQLAAFRDGARARNEALIARLNQKVPDIALDYAGQVLPLTPSGNATERHIISAYVDRAHAVFEDPERLMAFLSELLEKDVSAVQTLLADRPSLEEAMRSRLAKRGGLGYVQPSVDAFPPVETFLSWVAGCDAIPMITWLDGSSGGESNPREMCEHLCAKGAGALNIVPDRNWNIADPDARAEKIGNLKAIVDVAVDMGLPVNIGTEMNKLGLPFVDDLDGSVLSEFKETFLSGARIMVGHTLLARYAAFPYMGSAAAAEFSGVAERNRCFESVGALAALSNDQADLLEEMGPERALSWFRDRISV